MPEYLSPGVYVEEIDSGPKPIEGVGTATAAFIGFTEKAQLARRVNGDVVIQDLLNRPQLVTNWTQFGECYGGFVDGAYLPHAVYAYFENGGTRCYVVSLATLPKAQAPLLNSEDKPRLLVRARHGGLEGQRLRVRVEVAEPPAAPPPPRGKARAKGRARARGRGKARVRVKGKARGKGRARAARPVVAAAPRPIRCLPRAAPAPPVVRSAPARPVALPTSTPRSTSPGSGARGAARSWTFRARTLARARPRRARGPTLSAALQAPPSSPTTRPITTISTRPTRRWNAATCRRAWKSWCEHTFRRWSHNV